MSQLPIAPQDLPAWCQYILQLSGVVLDASKAYLFESRLSPILHRLGCSYAELLQRSKVEAKLQAEVLDAMTTHETSFFRDTTPFKLFRQQLLPQLLATQPKLRIWSAACSTGQEPYSLSFILHDSLKDVAACQILATDISDHALAIAQAGEYSDLEIHRGLDPHASHRYFEKTPKNHWLVRPLYRKNLDFKNLNLIHDFRAEVPPQNLIFCRNVAIYFSLETRRILYDRLADCLLPGGLLIVSSTESLVGITERFTQEDHQGAKYYRKNR
jgi:chemotaxis protein methyltransferase CheR